ncbi:NUDIX hydrolase [Oribacterium sp. WCC10]|uniref:NUDIX hydrolase n=1 Tax=Oribacterium sp. WCC10 TaxID=1855343 RepID=UPI0008ED2D3E|nr:NUDIX hydrolase [Oribacterium sp. WCC10]SFG74255.1 ADP-ribose pyrophosphatase [Oribacterium sp. WCC10]
MEFKGIKRIESGNFIHRYDVLYETNDHKEKTYEIVSRNPNITSLEELSDWGSKTVSIIGLSRNHNRILLNKEYQMAVGDWVYNFPSGLIDEGETPTEAAKRELMEETGLHFVKRIVRLKSSFNSVGLSNESSSCVIAIVDGDIQESNSSFEEIQAMWLTKNEVKELLKTAKMSARAQLFCFLWVYGDLSLDRFYEHQEDFGTGNLR